MVPTGRLALLALAGAAVVGLLAPTWWGVLAVAVVLLTLAVVDSTLAGSVRVLRLDRSGDSAARLGEPATVVLTVTNPGSRRLRGRLRDAWPPSAGVLDDRADIDVPPGERRRLEVVLHPTRRGDRRADRVTVRSVGPLGLAARQGSHAAPWTVRVLPPFRSRRHLPSRLARLRELDGRSAIRVRGQGTEFDSLREYVVGDEPRSIDWRATARGGDVVVRTWRPERDRHVLLVLDTARTAAARVGDAPRLDAAMDAALLLAALATRAGDRVELVAFDRRVRVAVERPGPTEVLPRLVQAMAPLEAGLVETDHRKLVAEVLTRAGHHALVVLLTGLDTDPVESGLLPLVGRLTRRHTVVLASVADPQVLALAHGRGDVAAVYGAAAAESEGADRRRLVTLLERRGVHVVDAPPEELPPALSDAYLDLKAAGRL
jgi:uncharacterized protein (DUF58 family)